MNKDQLYQKIWGSWIGKVTGGTFAMPAEGRTKKMIQKRSIPLSGWIERHKQIVNDDEQYELIALLALEDASDTKISELIKENRLFDAKWQGPYWEENLDKKYVFTAEKAALVNAQKHQVPWEHAGDEIYNGQYSNQYFDWIGAQMKGELFGLLSPVIGWHNQDSGDPAKDLALLRRCLDMSLNDALVAHREIAIIGELFVSAMVAIGIDYNPNQHSLNNSFPKPSAESRTPIEERMRNEMRVYNGVSAEILISDMKRLKEALLLYEKVEHRHVKQYFKFIDVVIEDFESHRDSSKWEETWNKLITLWKVVHKMHKKEFHQKYSRRKNYKQFVKREIAIIAGPAVHTLLNNGFIAVGLIYGDGDFSQTIIRATECGRDTDCNAGNAAAILGAYLGQELIPNYMLRYVRGEIISPLKNWTGDSIQGLSKRTLTQHIRIKNLWDQLEQ